MKSCTLDDIVALWEATSTVNEYGEIQSTNQPDEHGYTCTNCGLGFADWAGCVGHIVGRFVPQHELEEAAVEAKETVAETIPEPEPDTTPPAVSLE